MRIPWYATKHGRRTASVQGTSIDRRIPAERSQFRRRCSLVSIQTQGSGGCSFASAGLRLSFLCGIGYLRNRVAAAQTCRSGGLILARSVALGHVAHGRGGPLGDGRATGGAGAVRHEENAAGDVAVRFAVLETRGQGVPGEMRQSTPTWPDQILRICARLCQSLEHGHGVRAEHVTAIAELGYSEGWRPPENSCGWWDANSGVFLGDGRDELIRAMARRLRLVYQGGVTTSSTGVITGAPCLEPCAPQDTCRCRPRRTSGIERGPLARCARGGAGWKRKSSLRSHP